MRRWRPTFQGAARRAGEIFPLGCQIQFPKRAGGVPSDVVRIPFAGGQIEGHGSGRGKKHSAEKVNHLRFFTPCTLYSCPIRVLLAGARRRMSRMTLGCRIMRLTFCFYGSSPYLTCSCDRRFYVNKFYLCGKLVYGGVINLTKWPDGI